MNASRQVEAIVQTGRKTWRAMERPARTLEAHTPDAVSEVVGEVERLTREEGWFAAGFLAYEAAAAYGLPALPPRDGLPLAWFALFEPANVREIGALPPVGSYELGGLTPSLGRSRFRAAFARIREHLADGDTYQVNFTFRMEGACSGDSRGLFADLVAAQQGEHSAYLWTGEHAICSASPELFFELDGASIRSRPMKGTSRRGRTLAEDERLREELRGSLKQRAENVMIVDMMRNDLGRIADPGSVSVPELFSPERYPNVWQMTSLVTATTRASLTDIFAALHPPASITGAPKMRTMEIIRSLEDGPRGVYTGAIGYIGPDGNGQFNVAIRTAVVHERTGRLEFGVGSGIVWDSDPDAEYDECLLKGAVLGARSLDFELLETTAWDPSGGFARLERHLSRMRDSAEYFGCAFDERAVRDALAAAVAGADGPLRVRWLVSQTGAVRVEALPLEAWAERPMRVALAAAPVDSANRFLFHKTTERAVYERARRTAVDDVILWNDRGEVTEATTANVFVELADGTVATPPVDCALLGGTARAEQTAEERVITLEDLRSARRIWLTNSVYGRREAVLVDLEEES